MTIDVISVDQVQMLFGQLCALCNFYADHLFEVVLSAARRVAHDFPFSVEPDERDQPFWGEESSHMCSVTDFFACLTQSDRRRRLMLTNALDGKA